MKGIRKKRNDTYFSSPFQPLPNNAKYDRIPQLYIYLIYYYYLIKTHTYH